MDDSIEQLARQQMLMQALYHIVEQSEGREIEIPFSVLEHEGNKGGLVYDVNYNEKTVVLRAVTKEQVTAMIESFDEVQH